jgi:hypothetical protein
MHTHAKAEVGQIIDVVDRVSDESTIDLLTRDFGEIPSPTDG